MAANRDALGMKKRYVLLFVALALILGAIAGWIASATSFGERNAKVFAALALNDVKEALRALEFARSGDTNTLVMLEHHLDEVAMRLAIGAQQTKDSDQRTACARALTEVLNEHRAHPRSIAFPDLNRAIAVAVSPEASQ